MIFVGVLVLQILGGVGGNIATQFPVSNTTNTAWLYNVYYNAVKALSGGAQLLSPVVLAAIGALAVVVVILIYRFVT